MKNLYKRISFLGVLILFSITFSDCRAQQEKHEFTNALINETSPYLLQHAHNPVNWFPWTQEILDQAKKEDKLVLVSIGYSSCHWCHVMEEESFKDKEVAQLMNANFINIKVDREERPDIDQIYQTFVQLVAGDGGWPLNVIVLPNGKPLYGNTYHTKEQWMQTLGKINDLYRKDPEAATEYADQLAKGIQEANIIEPVVDTDGLSQDDIKQAMQKWKQIWDLEWGGNKGSQKFMLPASLNFLLDYALLVEDEEAKMYLKTTLDKMAIGGIFDQVGGGFYRYSTDPEWKVPHFEKMLYDNAQLLSVYAKAYQVFKDPEYKQIAIAIADFLDREMENGEGAYFAAMDADSEGEEGKYYIWTIEELKAVLNADFDLASKYYNVIKGEEWENENYVVHRKVGDKAFAQQNGTTMQDVLLEREQWNKNLLEERMKRKSPAVDDKIITSWNALLINGYVDAYNAFGEKVFLDRAEAIFKFLRENSYRNKELVHSYKKGGTRLEGFLEDYVFLVQAALKLYETTLKPSYLEFGQWLNDQVELKFVDNTSSMYKYNIGKNLISKIFKTHDGVVPSPNAIAAQNLFKLGHLTYNTDFLQKSKSMLASMSPLIDESIKDYAQWGDLMLNTVYPYFEVAIVGRNAATLMIEFHENYVPNVLVVGSSVKSELPLFEGRYVEDETFIYVCQNSTCKFPVQTVKEAIRQMDK